MHGKQVRAAQLKRSGDRLMGLNEIEVRVIDVEKCMPVERTLICLTTSESYFEITANHRLLVKGPDGNGIAEEARNLKQRFERGETCQVFDGTKYDPILGICQKRKTTQVIDVCFEDADVTVLAWFPHLKSSAKLVNQNAFAVFGRDVADRIGLIHGNPGFKSNQFSQRAIRCGRARSAGATPDPKSSWSFGTRHHSEADPHRCVIWHRICPIHHRYIQSCEKEGISTKARPCKKGAACNLCHAEHPEAKKRIR
jgi:hypothetical protein